MANGCSFTGVFRDRMLSNTEMEALGEIFSLLIGAIAAWGLFFFSQHIDLSKSWTSDRATVSTGCIVTIERNSGIEKESSQADSMYLWTKRHS